MEEPTTRSLLTQHERSVLESYIARSTPEAAYFSRAKIMLLADDGASQELIAVEAQVPITRVRQMLRAFHRERMGLFPRYVLLPQLFSPDDPIAEAGRQIMAQLLENILAYIEDLETTTSVTALHETRKNTRQLRTALWLFAPYYEPGILKSFRSRFRKFMRQLGQSRDTVIFLLKLEQYMTEAAENGQLSAEEIDALTALKEYWQGELEQIDTGVRVYLAKSKAQTLFSDFKNFVHTPGAGVLAVDPPTPVKTRHLVPALIAERLAAVRAFDDLIVGAPLATIHALRIQFKELRYTLEFFEPILGPGAAGAIQTVKHVLEHLGNLNDARVHLEMLDRSSKGTAQAVALYRPIKETELARLRRELPQLWAEFDSIEWRRQYAEAIISL